MNSLDHLKAPICACGHQMILRKGEYGRFYGCSKFPKCRHTEQADPDDFPENDEQ